MSSYQHRDPHIKDKKVFRQGNPHTWARRSLYWDGVPVLVIKHYSQASNISRTTDRRSSNYIWVINTFITYSGVTYISDLTARKTNGFAYPLMLTTQLVSLSSGAMRQPLCDIKYRCSACLYRRRTGGCFWYVKYISNYSAWNGRQS